MKKFKPLQCVFIFTLLMIGCEKTIENATPEYPNSFIGTWQGNLGEIPMQIEFEEVPFEGAIFITGDANLTIDSRELVYKIMNGARGENNLSIALYRTPVVTKEEFHVEGILKTATTLEGTYKQFEVGPSNPQIIRTGTWRLSKID